MTTPKQPSRPVEAASAAPGEKRSVSPKLGRASESGDAAVHQALGNLYTAQQNLAAAKREGVEDAEAEESERQARAQLKELGYE